MIETRDHKKFFTHEKNFPQLIEFSKTFNAEISRVQIPSETEILELEELAPALCEKKSQNADYTVIETKLRHKTSRKNIISRAKKIQLYIKQSLLNGKIVSLKDLRRKYKGQITNACLCNHFKQIRESLGQEGHGFIKIGGGKYKIT